MHSELTALGEAGFAVNGVWRPAVPGPHTIDVQRHAWLEGSSTKRYVWRYVMAAGIVWGGLWPAAQKAAENTPVNP